MLKKTIGIVIPAEAYLFSRWVYSYYFTEILRGAVASAGVFKWNLLIHHSHWNTSVDYAGFCEDENEAEDMDGIVYLAPALSERALKKIKEKKIPVIIINDRYPGISYIDTDNKQGASKAAQYLIELGHTDIAIINGDMSTVNACDRYKGYKMALSKAGIELNKDMVKQGKFSEDSGFYEMENILSEKKIPTAVLCANDLIAIGAIKAIKEKNLKVPQDISVIGFDDLLISFYFTPSLTTVRQPLFHLGKEAVVTLISVIMGERENNQKIEIETKLIKRESTANLSFR